MMKAGSWIENVAAEKPVCTQTLLPGTHLFSYMHELSRVFAVRTVTFGKDHDIRGSDLLGDVGIHVLAIGEGLCVTTSRKRKHQNDHGNPYKKAREARATASRAQGRNHLHHHGVAVRVVPSTEMVWYWYLVLVVQKPLS
jgi:hypothetical protein